VNSPQWRPFRKGDYEVSENILLGQPGSRKSCVGLPVERICSKFDCPKVALANITTTVRANQRVTLFNGQSEVDHGLCLGDIIGRGDNDGVVLRRGGVPPLQWLIPRTAPNESPRASSAAGRHRTSRSRSRSDLGPKTGNSRRAIATSASGLPDVGRSFRAFDVFVVRMANVIAVIALPAAMVVGEKAAVAPVGRPVAEKPYR
jgi:hypothetical protein